MTYDLIVWGIIIVSVSINVYFLKPSKKKRTAIDAINDENKQKVEELNEAIKKSEDGRISIDDLISMGK